MMSARRIVVPLFLLFLAALSFSCASPNEKSAAPLESKRAATGEPVVLVCDIDVISNDLETGGLGLALSSLMRRDLFCVRRLSVIPTDDINIPPKAFFLAKTGLKQLATAHGADIAITGLLSAKEDRITVELMAYDLTADSLVLKTTVGGKRESIYALERQIVDKLVKALDIELQADEYHRMRSHNPEDCGALAYYGIGLIYEKKEKFTDALLAYDKALSNDERLAPPLAAEARVFNHMNAPQKALHLYEKAVERDPFYAEAWYRLNLYIALHQQDDNKALEYCQKSLEISPRFGKARLSLGTRLYDLGRLSEAIEETRLAASLLRTDPIPCYNLGLYTLEAGDQAAAREWFAQALRLNPQFEPARIELQKLEQK